ncbi:MAG: methionyl-tRNA formyltransferase [Acidimicrobiia bacterium]|nr:methionyl-tRNA formyltransferase [Acidimicrobiia bacterium]
MSRVAFLGTPEAALPTLRSLAADHDVAVVITQPDREKGRGRAMSPPPVKLEGDRLGLPVVQPSSTGEVKEALESAGNLDVAVVVAYGRILKPDALAVPAAGMVNLHFSLLPRWRGAAPVSRALMAGDPMTGVTIFRLDEGLDTGPVLTAQAVDIDDEETAGDLTSRLAALGARLMTGAIPPYLDGGLEPVPQSDEGLVYASKIEPQERVIKVSGSRVEEVNRIRGLSPEPGASLIIDGETHQVLQARLHEAVPEPGRWMEFGGVPVAGLADGGVQLVTLLPPGKRPMSGESWLRGRRRDRGSIA